MKKPKKTNTNNENPEVAPEVRGSGKVSLDPVQLEKLIKPNKTIEFRFENGMSALDFHALGEAVEKANAYLCSLYINRPTEADMAQLKLLAITAFDKIPKAIIKVAEKVSKKDAIALVSAHYQETIRELKERNDELIKKIQAPVFHANPPELTDTEETLLEGLGSDTLNGPELLKKAGYDNSSHYRSILSNLVKRQILGRNSKGYYAL